ncbi:MAG: substrate-binding domain-containing protein [Pirellulales bacterium]
MSSRIPFALACVAICLGDAGLAAAQQPAVADSRPSKTVVRAAIIGGMTDTGFWQELSARFEKASGISVEVVATGPKHETADVLQRGAADLLTMHASDTVINLVADGYGVDPQPWARNDLLLVGPASDPAKIKGMTDAVAALRRIVEGRAKLLVHRSLGANEVLYDLLADGALELSPEHTVMLPSDRHRQLLKRAAAENAYAIVGRIPFLNGKIASEGLEIMVQGDPRMRRPYVVIVGTVSPPGDARREAARQLALFMRSPDTQRWIAEFGRGALDERPLFFSVVLPPTK